MNYENFNIEHFLEDQEFVEWVMNPTSQNAAHWENVIRQSPKKENDIRMAVEILRSLNAHVTDSELEEDANNIWQRVSAIPEYDRTKQVERQIQKKHVIAKYWLQIAASVLIVIGLSWWMYPIINQNSQSTEEVAIISESNPKGKKSRITLRDGSVVWLNSESRIQYSDDYGQKIREISLEGEAFFEVAKNPDIPFVVRSGNISTTALGTSFNVSNYPENKNILVSLATGKIVVKDEILAKPYYLEPGDHVSYSNKDHVFKEWHNESAITFLWKDRIIQFNKASLEEMISYLERWYDVEFEIEGNIPKDIVYTGTFDNESLEKVLIGLAFSLHFDHEIENKHIKIKFSENQ